MARQIAGGSKALSNFPVKGKHIGPIRRLVRIRIMKTHHILKEGETSAHLTALPPLID
jgi:hypothetical protein